MKTLRIALSVPDFICMFAESILQIYSRIRYGRDSRLISLGLGEFAMVDADDYPRLAMHTWCIKTDTTNSYAVRFFLKSGKTRKSLISMHREVMNSPKGLCVDHINGNGLDNRKANLRSVTRMQNNWNRKKRVGNYSSRFKGISLCKRSGKWRAQIKCKGKDKYLGVFAEEEAAARAYDAKARELYGEYAWLNLPEDANRLLTMQSPNLCLNNDGNCTAPIRFVKKKFSKLTKKL